MTREAQEFSEAREVMGDVPRVTIFNPRLSPQSIVGVDGVSVVTFPPKSRTTLREDELSSAIKDAIKRRRLEVEPTS